MSSFVDPQNGDLATAEHVAQLVEDFQGLRNIPISLSGINDAATYALTLKNAGTGSRDLIAYAADGTTVLLQVDATGVTLGAPVNVPPGSISGSAIAAGSITNAMLGPDVARANLLCNGSMDVWQRGNGPFTIGGVYGTDRWMGAPAGTDTLSISKDTANVDVGSNACAACTFVLGTGAGTTQFRQYLLITTDPYPLRGRTISLSLRVRTSTANAVRASVVSDGTGAVQLWSGFHTGGGAYETLTVTYSVPTNATYVGVMATFTASCTAYVDNAMLVVGSQAANYVPMHPADDLARCLRYYEVLGDPAGGDLLLGAIATAGAQIIRGTFPYKAVKPVSPTVTKVGTWGLTNAGGQPTMITGSKNNTAWYLGSTAAGEYFTSNSAATTCFTVESNP
jgi:hypothetical protein